MEETYDFIHIPKTAGCSFYKLIENHSDKVSYLGHEKARKRKSIAIVRNPYDRIVSTYFYYINNEVLGEKLPEYKNIARSYRDFSNFVMSIRRDGLISKLIHLQPMSYWVADYEGKIIVDNIFKIEEPESINKFMDSIGINCRIQDVRINTSSHLNFREYLGSSTGREIRSIYSLDFKLFNYSKYDI